MTEIITDAKGLLNELNSLPEKKIRRALYKAAIGHSIDIASEEGFNLIKTLLSEKRFAESEGLYHWLIDLLCAEFSHDQRQDLLTIIYNSISLYRDEVADGLGGFIAEKYPTHDAIVYMSKMSSIKERSASTLADTAARRLLATNNKTHDLSDDEVVKLKEVISRCSATQHSLRAP